jgi:hypothetical protein
LSAVKNPTKVTEQAGGKTAYTGKDAKVVLNSEGKVITTIPKDSEALRDPKVEVNEQANVAASSYASRRDY